MDPRLEEASRAGDLDALNKLLQQDRLLLDRLNSNPRPADNPLHIAALLGHVKFGAEILRHSPGLARSTNAHGLSPLHLASSGGHLHMVGEILKAGGVDLCRIRDGDGLIPLHTAASSGWVRVLELLIKSDPESALELTYTGDTALHLALKSRCFEAAEFLVRKMDNVQEILNSKDENGDTALHLATAKRQVQIMKLLLSKQGIDVNMVNSKGQTALDVLLQSQFEHGDLALGELIRAAGGTSIINTRSSEALPSSVPPLSLHTTTVERFVQWKRSLLLHIRRLLEFIFDTHPDRDRRRRERNEEGDTSGTVMVVSTLIATITFQSAVNPPGGFDPKTGKSVLGQDLNFFLVPDVIGLFSSLSVILIFICVVPRGGRRKLTKLLLWVMWIAVYSTAYAFIQAIVSIFPDSIPNFSILLEGWVSIQIATSLWVYLRFVVYFLQKVGWWWEEENPRHQIHGPLIIIKRIMVLGMVLAANYSWCLLVANFFPWDVWLPFFFAVFAIPSLWIYLWLVLCSLRVVGWWKKKKKQGNVESNGSPSSTATTQPYLVIKRILTVIIIATTPFVVALVAACPLTSSDCPPIILYHLWISLFGVPGLFLCFSSITYLLGMAGWWWKGRGANATPTRESTLLGFKRILVVIMIVILVFSVGYVSFYLPFQFFESIFRRWFPEINFYYC